MPEEDALRELAAFASPQSRSTKGIYSPQSRGRRPAETVSKPPAPKPESDEFFSGMATYRKAVIEIGGVVSAKAGRKLP